LTWAASFYFVRLKKPIKCVFLNIQDFEEAHFVTDCDIADEAYKGLKAEEALQRTGGVPR
jgi:hypothetical protein